VGDVFTAVLGCGSILMYEARSFVPTKGERVPCRRHGYCAVIQEGRMQLERSRLRDVTRARPRGQDELLTWLQSYPGSTMAALRRERFTLRLIFKAERDGLIVVDSTTETVAMAAAEGADCHDTDPPSDDDRRR
jgi:hypothetical protein